MRAYGLAAGLHDAVALAGRFGLECSIGLGSAQAPDADILAPEMGFLSALEVSAAARLGRPGYFFSFGADGVLDIPALAARIEQLAAATGVGFMAACVAQPEAGRTVYQGHLFHGGRLQCDLIREFGLSLEGSAGLVGHDIVSAGPAAIRAQCGRLKEAGKTLALIDMVAPQEGEPIAAAMAGLALAGGAAWAVGGEAPAPPTGRPHASPVAILAGACDRQTLFQIGATRGQRPVFDLDFASPDPVNDAASWAAMHLGDAAFIIASSTTPDRLNAEINAASLLAEIAARLAGLGVRDFLIAGDATAGAILRRLGVTKLHSSGASAPLQWLHGDKYMISLKPSGGGAKNLFLSEFEPQIRRNNIAEMAS